MTPFIALVLYGSRGSVGWFVAYVGLLTALGLADPLFAGAGTPSSLIVAFFVLISEA